MTALTHGNASSSAQAAGAIAAVCVAGAAASLGSIYLAGAIAGLLLLGILQLIFGIRGVVLAVSAVLLIGLPIPVPLRALCEVGLVGITVWMTLNAALDSRWMRAGRIAYLFMVAIYAVLLIHPNVPGLTVGVQGVRSTIVCVTGLMLGLSLAGRDRPATNWSTVRFMLWLLVAAAVASLSVHLFAPGIESGFTRGADVATSRLGGETRMQGLLSGPFHVAMLGAFLALVGVWRLVLREFLGLPFLALGVALLFLARVRTGLIAWVIGLLLLAGLFIVIKRRFPSMMKAIRRPGLRSLALGAILIVSFTTIAFVAQQNVAVQQLNGIESDHRVNDRRSTMEIAFELARESPWVGWGPGSATSGLDDEFAATGGTHITPHNGALGLVVEAGIGAIACFLTIAISLLLQIWRQVRFRFDPRRDGLVIAALASIGTFWIFGDGLAATPISYCLAFILGACLEPLASRVVPVEQTEQPRGLEPPGV